MRSIPLIVVASTSAVLAENVAANLRRDGSVVYVAHSAEGCLRVATSVGPDMVVLDRALPPRLERLLHAHPASAKARIMHVDDQMITRRVAPPEPWLHAAA
jgi:DNA-binding response OmpR family regulator